MKTAGWAAPTRLAARVGRGEDGSFLASRGRGSGQGSRATVAPVTEDAIRESLSQRVADTLLGARESWTRRMFELANSMRADGGGPVYDLSLGNPSLEPPARWKEAVRAQLADSAPGRHRYMTNAGFPEVRAFIAGREAERYAIPLEAEDVAAAEASGDGGSAASSSWQGWSRNSNNNNNWGQQGWGNPNQGWGKQNQNGQGRKEWNSNWPKQQGNPDNQNQGNPDNQNQGQQRAWQPVPR